MPFWPFIRNRAAPPPPQVRSFDAATGGRRAPRRMGPLNPEIAAAADSVARGARYHRMNHPWLANGTENLRTALVGSGLRPTPRSLSGPARRAATDAFERWAAEADAAGVTDFYGLQSIVAEHLVTDGEGLVVLHDDPDGLRLQVIPPEHLDRSRTAELPGGGVIAQGVELDPRGRRLAYWILPERPTSPFGSWGEAQRIPAEHVCHIFRPMTGGQVRGISWLAPAILTASELDQLTDALLMQAKTGAMLGAFVTDPGQLGQSPFPDASGSVADLSLEPGTLRILPPGTDIRFLTPETLKDAPAFVRMNLQALAAALGVPEHYLSGDLSQANYSSLRAALIPFRQRIEAAQYHVLVPQFLAPVWRRWVALESLSGRLDLPPDTPAEWIAPRQPWVDPAKDAAAVREMLALGLMSRTQAVAELGWDIEALDAEIAADRDREAALGLDFTAVNAGVPDGD